MLQVFRPSSLAALLPAPATTRPHKPIFHRPTLAEAVVEDLLSLECEQGLLLSGPRRIGKSTFIRRDVLPLLRRRADVHTMYIDLNGVRDTDPGHAILKMIELDLQTFEGPVMKVARRLGLTQVRLGGLEMHLDQVWTGRLDLVLLPQLKALSAVTGKHIVLVIDEIHLARQTELGRKTLFVLKSALDQLNDLGGPSFRLLGTGSHAQKLSQLVFDKSQPLYGATLSPFPVLGGDFLLWQWERMHHGSRPALRTLVEAFAILLDRPEELFRVCRVLDRQAPDPEASVDQRCMALARLVADAKKEEFVRRIQRLPAQEFALLRVMAEEGEAFAPHFPRCMRRMSEIILAATGRPAAPTLSADEIDGALERLAQRRLIWQEGTCAFEDLRHADWLRSLDIRTLFLGGSTARAGTDRPASPVTGASGEESFRADSSAAALAATAPASSGSTPSRRSTRGAPAVAA